jgi:hypothetical protein
MAQPVWVLSVDLQTKTATFQSGMADAAKSARGAFTDIKSGAEKMGSETSYSMMEARHSVMILGEELGVKIPRALAGFIAGLGPVGAAMEAAFPFLAIALGATLLIEHLTKMHEAGEKLTEDQTKFGTAAQNAFNSLDNKILQAQIHSDELRNDHLGALSKQLILIDKQSMAELVHEFEGVAKAADAVLDGLKKSWYEFGTGSEGAKHAVTEFKNEYESLLGKGKDKEASDLLKGTRESAEKVLAAMKQVAAAKAGMDGAAVSDGADQLKYNEAMVVVKKAGYSDAKENLEVQQAVVDLLLKQTGIEERNAKLKGLESGNAKTNTGKEMGKEQSEAAKQAAEHTLKMSELSVAAEREAANVRLTLSHATTQERLASDLALANEEYQIQKQGNEQRIGALDKGGKDYQNQLKGLHEKTEELTREHENRLAQLQGKASEDQYRKDLTDLEQSTREKINATQQGSAERLAAIQAAITDEQSRNLQDTSFYRELLQQRVELIRKAAEDERKAAADAGKEKASSDLKMGELGIAAEREQAALKATLHRLSSQEQMEQETKFANEEFNAKKKALDDEMATMDKTGKDYENKLKQLQDKEKGMTQQHEDELTAIKDKAEKDRNTRVLSAEQTAMSQMASGLTKSIMGHQTWASMVTSLGNQAAEGLIKNSLMILMQQDKERLGDAKKAASSAYATGESMGGPAGIVLGPVFAAAAFAGVMAFQSGTDGVPGFGKGDRVPAMLEPGEGVVPGGVMDGLRSMARSGTMGGGHQYHIHAPVHFNLSALDSTGMDKVLDKHGDKLQKHFEKTLRKMNH